MKKNLLLLTNALAASMLLLSACGNSTTTSGAASPSSSAAASISASPASATASGAASPSPTSDAGKVVEIKLMAKDFEYDQTEIHVKKGDKVKITLESDDGGHGFTIPAYKVTINGNHSAEFTADKAGTFEYHCSVFCGSGHSKMKGKLIVDA